MKNIPTSSTDVLENERANTNNNKNNTKKIDATLQFITL
jgi:hypothetical protein